MILTFSFNFSNPVAVFEYFRIFHVSGKETCLIKSTSNLPTDCVAIKLVEDKNAAIKNSPGIF